MTCEDYEPDEWEYRQRRVSGPRAPAATCDVATDTLPSHPCPRCGEPTRVTAVGAECDLCARQS